MIIKLQPSGGRSKGWYFEVQAEGNHATLVTSETYKRKSDALKTIRALIGGLHLAVVVDVEAEAADERRAARKARARGE